MTFWTCARRRPGRRHGIYGRLSSPGDQSQAGSSLEKSGGATLGAIGYIRSSLSTRMVAMNDQRSITNDGGGIRTQDLAVLPLNFELSLDNFPLFASVP